MDINLSIGVVNQPWEQGQSRAWTPPVRMERMQNFKKNVETSSHRWQIDKKQNGLHQEEKAIQEQKSKAFINHSSAADTLG